MADVDRRTAGHAAGLRRLSTRAASNPSNSISISIAAPRSGLQSFCPLAEAIISHLRVFNIAILPGLSDSEFARIEAELGFTFPPDLRAVLSLGLPSGPRFPNWRSISDLRSSINLPLAAISLQIARGWPPRARSSLRRAPLMIPLFDRCYIPCRPSLAGNPIFFVDETRVLCCGFDLPDFFRRDSSFRSPDRSLRRQKSASEAAEKHPRSPPPLHSTRRSLDSIAGKAPRWIEFWSDAASDCRRRNSSSSSLTPPMLQISAKIRLTKLPEWVGIYLDRIGSVLRQGGWGESEVSEMVELSSSFSGVGIIDDEAVLDGILLKADRCLDSLRAARWSSEEISDAFCFDFQRERLPVQKLPPEIASKIVKLAEAVSQS